MGECGRVGRSHEGRGNLEGVMTDRERFNPFRDWDEEIKDDQHPSSEVQRLRRMVQPKEKRDGE